MKCEITVKHFKKSASTRMFLDTHRNTAASSQNGGTEGEGDVLSTDAIRGSVVCHDYQRRCGDKLHNKPSQHITPDAFICFRVRHFLFAYCIFRAEDLDLLRDCGADFCTRCCKEPTNRVCV